MKVRPWSRITKTVLETKKNLGLSTKPINSPRHRRQKSTKSELLSADRETRVVRDRGYAKERVIQAKEWREAGDHVDMAEEEDIPDSTLLALNIHLDEFGIMQDGYQRSLHI